MDSAMLDGWLNEVLEEEEVEGVKKQRWGNDSQRRWILLACSVERPINKEMAKIFGDDIETRIVKMSDFIVTNYGSERQVSTLLSEINKNFRDWLGQYKAGDEVYVVLVGGNLQISLLLRRLMKKNIPYKLLVYEKKLNRYVIIEDMWNSVEVM